MKCRDHKIAVLGLVTLAVWIFIVLANILAAPICAPSAAFGRLPPIPAALPPRPPPPRANEAAGVAKIMNNAIATFTEVFDMVSSTNIR